MDLFKFYILFHFLKDIVARNKILEEENSVLRYLISVSLSHYNCPKNLINLQSTRARAKFKGNKFFFHFCFYLLEI